MQKKEVSTDALVWKGAESVSPKGDETFDANEVIEAYFHGKKAGRDETFEIVSEKFKQNIVQLAEVADEIGSSVLEQIGIEFLNTFMKIESPTNFKLLFTVSEVDYVSDEILDAYEIISSFEEEHQTKTFRFLTSIVDETEEFDVNLVHADGYLIRVDAKE